MNFETANELLEYDPNSGYLTWKIRSPKHFKNGNTSKESNCLGWNKKYANKRADLNKDKHGYPIVHILNKTYRAHRIIWLLQTGNLPKNFIDHDNRNREDNCWINLKDKTRTENNRNMSQQKTNTSGVSGVDWFKPAKLWRARISNKNISINLGYFKSFEDAVKCRLEAEKDLGYHPNHRKFI